MLYFVRPCRCDRRLPLAHRLGADRLGLELEVARRRLGRQARRQLGPAAEQVVGDRPHPRPQRVRRVGTRRLVGQVVEDPGRHRERELALDLGERERAAAGRGERRPGRARPVGPRVVRPGGEAGEHPAPPLARRRPRGAPASREPCPRRRWRAARAPSMSASSQVVEQRACASSRPRPSRRRRRPTTRPFHVCEPRSCISARTSSSCHAAAAAPSSCRSATSYDVRATRRSAASSAGSSSRISSPLIASGPPGPRPTPARRTRRPRRRRRRPGTGRSPGRTTGRG